MLRALRTRHIFRYFSLVFDDLQLVALIGVEDHPEIPLFAADGAVAGFDRDDLGDEDGEDEGAAVAVAAVGFEGWLLALGFGVGDGGGGHGAIGLGMG